MNLASIITEDATVMAIVRDRAERLWRRNGRLSFEDMEYATRSTYICSDKDRELLAKGYYERMVEVSKRISYIMSHGSNENIYKFFFGVKPKHEVQIESRPYGIHFVLHDEDIEATGTEMGNGFAGIAILLDDKKGLKIDSKRISHSIGPKYDGNNYSSLDEFTQDYVERTISNKKLSDKFKRKFKVGLADMLEVYKNIKSNSCKYWFAPKWKKMAIEMRCEMLWENFRKDIMRDYLKSREKTEEITIIAEHELEHIHSYMMLSLSDSAVHEAAAYSTPKDIENRESCSLESVILSSKVYKDVINDEDMPYVIDIIKETRRRNFTRFQKKVLPIAISNCRIMDRLKLISKEIIDNVENIA